MATHAKFLELGMESPFDENWLERPSDDDKITTSIDLKGFEDIRRLALLAHATQVDPTSKYWFGLPPEIMKTIHPQDDYILARSSRRDRSSRGRPLCRSAPPGGPVAEVLLPAGR